MGSRTLTDDAVDVLRALPWPGNVRELSSFIERLLILCGEPTIDRVDVEGELRRSQTVAASAGPEASTDARRLEDHVRGAEREALREALERAGGNRSLAARLLGISRRTLYNKLGEHAIS